MELIKQVVVENKYTDLRGQEDVAKYDVYTLATGVGFADLIGKNFQLNYRLPGFRAGKIPRHVLENRIGNNELYGPYLSPVWNEFCAQNKIITGYKPIVDNIKVRLDGAVVFDVMTMTLPVVELDIKDAYKVDIASEALHMTGQALYGKRQRLVKTIPVDGEKAAIWGNLVDLDFSGTIDGQHDDDLNGKNIQIRIGGRMVAIPGFEEQCIGMKAGDIKVVRLDIPENFAEIMRHNPRAKYIAGKTVEFTLKMNVISEIVMPDDEELIQAEGFSSFEKLYASILDENIKIIREDEAKVPLKLIDLIVTDNESNLAAKIQKPLVDTRILAFLEEHKGELDKMTEEERKKAIERIAPNIQKALYQDVVYASLLKRSDVDAPSLAEMQEEAKDIVSTRKAMRQETVDAETLLNQEWYSVYRQIQRRKVLAQYSPKADIFVDKESEAYKTAMDSVRQTMTKPIDEVLDVALAEQKIDSQQSLEQTVV